MIGQVVTDAAVERYLELVKAAKAKRDEMKIPPLEYRAGRWLPGPPLQPGAKH